MTYNKNYQTGNDTIHNLSLSIKANNFIAIVGRSGSGKSTLLDLIMGLIDPSKGHFKGDEAIFSLEEILCIIGLCEIIMNITSYIWIYFIYLYILSISNTCKIFY